jgi:hypothetical protein
MVSASKATDCVRTTTVTQLRAAAEDAEALRRTTRQRRRKLNGPSPEAWLAADCAAVADDERRHHRGRPRQRGELVTFTLVTTDR